MWYRDGGTSAKTGFVIHSSSEARKGEGKESHLVDIELWTDFQSILWIYIYDTLLMTGRLPSRPTASVESRNDESWTEEGVGTLPACDWLYSGGGVMGEKRIGQKESQQMIEISAGCSWWIFTSIHTISGTWDSERVLLTALVVWTGYNGKEGTLKSNASWIKYVKLWWNGNGKINWLIHNQLLFITIL